ncbi:MAG: AfsR/SARP family transcriptional regulator, partial [Actinobacteria bacterium]|nr:AfsR/SARP family transcriptional regulator [Actinomycetota bacterium]
MGDQDRQGFRIGSPLPAPRTRLVGRAEERTQVAAAFGTSRLVTLTGPGGAGKTRLALAAAADIGAPAGVAWVELAEVDEPGLVADTVRAVLGVSGVSGTGAARAIIERVRDARVILALDNCEHVVTAAAGLVDQLLDGCPQLRVLATSREPLAVDGEVVWPVAPLDLPPADAATAAAVQASTAGQLFELRAQAALPAFRITDENAAQLARLCRGLDGLPLAIELAAARVRALSVAQIAAGLDGTVALLSGGSRSTPARHQSLRATLDWSHDLLGEPERIV